MTRKTNLLVVSLIAMMTVGAAHATSVTKEYVDGQDNQFYQRIKTQDSRIATIRDWVNPQDEDGNRAELTTEAQDAYRAINELDAAVKAIEIPEQVNADWNAESGAAQILNKPDMTQYATTAAVEQAIEDIEIPEQVNADWNAESGAAQILNKPDLSTYATTAAVEQAIENIEIPEQVNADWNAQSGAAQILNKPDLSTYATTAAMNEALADKADADDLDDLAEDVVALDTQINGDPENEEDTGLAGAVAANTQDISTLQETVTTNALSVATALQGKQDTISDLSTIRDNAAAGAGAAAALGEGFDSEHTVAAALDAKADLNDIPEQVQANWNETNTEAASYIANKPDLSTYATTAAVEQAIEAIDIPEQVQANWAQTDSSEVDFIKNKPTGLATETYVDEKVADVVAGDMSEALSAYVKKSEVEDSLDSSSTNPVQNLVVTGALGEKVPLGTVPQLGQYVLGFVDGVQTYIPIVDATGASGPAIIAATGEPADE
ncbi:MAG: hypothetical protein J6Y49_00175 [Alphaproteobacteria bacterium]|nr:hypothetical protein [Alphaproteobacteria bacterium]